MISLLFSLDHAVAKWCLLLPDWVKSSAHVAAFLITPMIHFVLWWLAVLLYKKYRKKLISIAGAVTITMLITGLLKIGCGRGRPELFLNQGINQFVWGSFDHDHLSFPSSHAAIAFTLLPLLLPYRLALPLATLLSLTRLISNQHFLSDTLAGAILGLTIAFNANKIGQMIDHLAYYILKTKRLD